MEIKEYTDRIREEIKKIDKDWDYELTRHIINGSDAQQSMERCNYLRGKKEGLNEAFNIFTDLVKEDL